MSSGMNVEQAKELASKKNYRWAVGNIKHGKGVAYKKATRILLHELAEIADKLVLCKDCKWHTAYDECTHPHWDSEEAVVYPIAMETDFCSYGERIEE